MTEIDREARLNYVRDLFATEDDVLLKLRQEMDDRGMPKINISPVEGRMLQFLLLAVNARLVVEIGSLAGYSGIWIARALPAGGRLITLEKEEDRAAVAARAFAQAGLAERAEVRTEKAPRALEKLADEGPFDALFIDADKGSYPEYLAWGLEHVRPGGLIMAHNAFWGGRVTDRTASGGGVEGIRAFNQQIADDPHLEGMIIPIGDGLAAAVRRA